MALSAVAEDYLKEIYALQEETDGRVRTSEIADALEVTAPTVTSMLDGLQERGLVEREKYGGVLLTPDGERVALEVVRHHRLLEAYLAEHLDYCWTAVHEEADRLEHHISDEFAARIEASLGDPRTDPHGDPIPTSALELPNEPDGASLSDFEEETAVLVERVGDREPDVLEYLSDRGIEPGAELRIVEVAPFGTIAVRPRRTDRTVSLSERIAQYVHVVPVQSA